MMTVESDDVCGSKSELGDGVVGKGCFSSLLTGLSLSYTFYNEWLNSTEMNNHLHTRFDVNHRIKYHKKVDVLKNV